MGSKSGSEYVFQHTFKGKAQADVYQGLLDWIKGENAVPGSSDGKSTIIATVGGARIFGSESPLSRKNIIFVIAATGDGILVTATMTHPRSAYDGRAKQARVRQGWGYLANQIWASIEGGELAKKYQRPIEQQREELVRTEARIKRKILVWTVIEFVLIIAEFFVGGYVSGNVMGEAAGIVWIALMLAFFALLLPLAIWIGILNNVRYALRRLKWREGLGLYY